MNAIARAFGRFGAPSIDAGPLDVLNLAVLAEETITLYSLGGGAQVRVEAEASVEARVRKDEFKEVLVNLIENARTAGARTVTIGVLRDAGGGARVSVADDGRGVRAEDLPHIFEPRFSTTTSGTGLGLAICRRLVNSWGGQIEVRSAFGEGTTVTVSVPS